MKKVALLVVFFFFFCSTTYSQESLRFVRIINTPDQMVGAEILKLAYKRLGIPIVIVEMPGKRALVESSEGKAAAENQSIIIFTKNMRPWFQKSIGFSRKCRKMVHWKG